MIDDDIEGDECSYCHAIVMVGICCVQRGIELRAKWLADKWHVVSERRAARDKRKAARRDAYLKNKV